MAVETKERPAKAAAACEAKVTVARGELMRAAAVASVVEAKQTIPILANMMVETVEGGLALTASDLDIAVRVVVPAEVEGGAMATTVAAKKLATLAGAADDDCAIVLTHEAGGRDLSMRAGRSRFKMPVLPVEDFPLIAFEAGEAALELTGKDLHAALSRTAAAESTEATRYYLMGTLLTVVDRQLLAVATNGHMLAELAIGEGPDGWPPVILPSKLTALLVRLLKDCGEPVAIALDKGAARVRLSWGAWTVTSKLVNGTFPDWRRVIPTVNSERRLTVDSAALQKATARAAQMSSAKSSAVALNISKDRLLVTCQSPENGVAEEEVPASAEFGELRIGLNAAYLRAIAAAASGDSVAFEFGDENAPVRVEPQAGGGFVGVVMPMRV